MIAASHQSHREAGSKPGRSGPPPAFRMASTHPVGFPATSLACASRAAATEANQLERSAAISTASAPNRSAASRSPRQVAARHCIAVAMVVSSPATDPLPRLAGLVIGLGRDGEISDDLQHAPPSDQQVGQQVLVGATAGDPQAALEMTPGGFDLLEEHLGPAEPDTDLERRRRSSPSESPSTSRAAVSRWPNASAMSPLAAQLRVMAAAAPATVGWSDIGASSSARSAASRAPAKSALISRAVASSTWTAARSLGAQGTCDASSRWRMASASSW